MTPMQYTVVIEPADDGTLSVWVPDLPGCTSSGRTRDEALAGIAEAIRGHVEVLREHGQPVPPPKSTATVVQAA
jgi:predicted RNase H-like HicB family nuclease